MTTKFTMPDDPENHDFYITDEKGTYGPLSGNSKKNQNKIRRLSVSSGICIVAKGRKPPPYLPEAGRSSPENII